MKNHALNESIATIRSMLLALALALGAGLTLVACEQQGPAEEAGENIDEAIEEARDSVNDAAEEAREDLDDAAEEAGDEMQDAADDIEAATDRN